MAPNSCILNGELDPIEVCNNLRQRGQEPALLLSAGDHPKSNKTILAWDFQAELVIPEGNPESLAQLQEFISKSSRQAPSFETGLIGWLGFEAARVFEPSLPVTHRHPLPDVCFRDYTKAIVWENGVATLFWDHQRPGDDEIRPLPLPQIAWESSIWTSNFSRQEFCQKVTDAKKLINAGDLFQVNLATRFSTKAERDPLQLLGILRSGNPSPYMAFIQFGDAWICSGSPEQLFGISDGQVECRPIAGTRPRGTEDSKLIQELITDPKEQAEHRMLVDLLRNDTARTAIPGTTRVENYGLIESYSHVHHMVSKVIGRHDGTQSIVDALQAFFPGGTITGAPKLRATRRIMETESVARGPYTGSIGWISGDNCDFNIMIRTITHHDKQLHIHAGAGIVADSIPENEWKEVGHKAAAFTAAVDGQLRPGYQQQLREGTAWNPPRVEKLFRDRRVLLIDNEDSFVYNLADYCASHGAQVMVVRNDEPVPEPDVFDATHIILSPGPGHPQESRLTLELARNLPEIPVLGVCLGHQAMGLATGAEISVNAPIHGKTSPMHHDGTGLLRGIAADVSVSRYHSLHIKAESLGDDWLINGALEDGTMMSMRHRNGLWHGVQFHPESVGTQGGMQIIQNFLELGP